MFTFASQLLSLILYKDPRAKAYTYLVSAIDLHGHMEKLGNNEIVEILYRPLKTLLL